MFRVVRRKVDFVILLLVLTYIAYILSQSKHNQPQPDYTHFAEQLRLSERLESERDKVAGAAADGRSTVSKVDPLPPIKTGDVLKVEQTRKRLPQVLIIGVQKGGARALTMFLQTHPDVLAAIGQINYFNLNENYLRGVEWYLEKMPSTRADQVTIERSVGYFYSDKAPERVHNMNSSVKLIVVVRDPTMRALSEYADLKARNPNYPPFEQLVIDKQTGRVNENYYITQNSVYHMHLLRWLKFFPLDQFLFVEGDELAESPLAVLHRVENFIGVRNYISSENIFLNKTMNPYYCAKQLQPIQRIQCAGHNKGWVAPIINPRVMRTMQSYYKRSIDEFQKITKLNFNWT